MIGKLILTGLEWKALSDIVSQMLAFDCSFRKIGKTPFLQRKSVEAAWNELAKERKVKFWIIYIEREGCDHLITIETRRPEDRERLIAGNERLLMCAPKQVRIDATPEVLMGIANACCKAKMLQEALSEQGQEFLTKSGKELAEKFWNRCHLHERRSMGNVKTQWRRKGYEVHHAEVPDTRNPKFHEGAKFLYDLEGVEK